MNYRFKTKVALIEEKVETRRAVLVGHDEMGKPIYELQQESLGWFVAFEGSRESISVGMEKPTLTVGQPVSIVIIPEDE